LPVNSNPEKKFSKGIMDIFHDDIKVVNTPPSCSQDRFCLRLEEESSFN
jgi:hypothetical protein